MKMRSHSSGYRMLLFISQSTVIAPITLIRSIIIEVWKMYVKGMNTDQIKSKNKFEMDYVLLILLNLVPHAMNLVVLPGEYSFTGAVVLVLMMAVSFEIGCATIKTICQPLAIFLAKETMIAFYNDFSFCLFSFLV